MKMFKEYKKAENYARKTGQPLWDTHALPERWAVGHPTIEVEEDGDNDWTEVLIEREGVIGG